MRKICGPPLPNTFDGTAWSARHTPIGGVGVFLIDNNTVYVRDRTHKDELCYIVTVDIAQAITDVLMENNDVMAVLIE